MKRRKPNNRIVQILLLCTAGLIMTVSGMAAHGAPSKDDTPLSDMIAEGTNDIRRISDAGKSKTDEYRCIISELVSKLDSIDQLSTGTGALYDLWTDPLRDPDSGKVTAALVNDSRFRSVDDIRRFMHSTLTEEAIKSRYPDIIDCRDPLFFERNGSLYVDISRTKGNVGFLCEDLTEIHEVDDNTFTAVLDRSDCFVKRCTTLKIVRADGGWKIADISTV